MGKKDSLTKVLAILGTILVWLPLLAPLVFGIVICIRSGMFRFDFLMPAELFPVVLAGAALLLWASFRARLYRRLICWALGIAIVMLVASQGVAVVTGLASGATPATGWQWVLVLTLFFIFLLALIVLAVGGALLARDLIKNSG
ncbi:MAG: hypothetical protein JW908_12335 [Anaerolineales bacterium]|nr:hypothetical protein [Anaerolineales bacterium]